MVRLAVPLMVVLTLTALSAVCAVAGEVTTGSEKLSFNGFLQGRFAGGDNVEEDFALRQAFLNIIATPTERSGLVLTLATFDPNPPDHKSDDIIVFNLFAEYQISDEWSVRIGQVPTYFGLETWQGSADRVALERAAILEKARPYTAGADLNGFWWASPSDRGVWFRRAGGGGSAPDIYLGVCNGQFRASDYNNKKNYSVDLKWTADWGQYGLSWFTGDYGVFDAETSTWTETTRRACDVYGRVNTGPWAFQAEFATGKLLGSSRNGWDLQAERNMPGKPYMPFAKYEEFTNKLSPHNDTYDAIHAGLVWDVDARNELTFQITDARIHTGGSRVKDTSFGLSWQTRF